MLYAHTPNGSGAWHPLADHLEAVARLAAEHAAPFGGETLAEWAGRWHDVGKASEAFQDYLAACAREPDRRFQTRDHKGAGVLRARGRCDELAFLIQGHHGGLPDKGDLLTRLKELIDPDTGQLARAGLARAIEAGLIEDPGPARADLPYPTFVSDPLRHELFLRFLFSALVDADHLDTEAHWSPEDAAQRTGLSGLPELAAKLKAAQASLTGQADDPVNQVRHEVYEACLRAAALPPGFFRLTVPTGGGKTRSSLAFALNHAIRHGLRRVVYVSPYLTITDQTADVYRAVLGDGRAVLEHHSDAGRHDDPTGPATPEAIWRKLAAENWDAPVIVTTAVQFFESLFGRRPTACRKLHRIARSVILLDEAQTLPTPFLVPILDVLTQLVAHYGATVVLSTATQPALASAPRFTGLPELHEIAPQPSRLFRALKRVSYEWPALTEEPWDWPRAAEELRVSDQVLAIVNTKQDALALLDALDDPEALHLSTSLCAAHRRDVLAVIRDRLAHGAPVRVVSTQVVEAGVDIDFPVVFRAVGPLDRIVQAAGRCNREGRLERGRVVVFAPAEGGQPPGPYQTGTDITQIHLAANDIDLDDPAIFERYFARLFGSVGLDPKGIQALRQGLAYERVATEFRVIADDTVSVLVRYRGIGGKEKETEQRDHGEIVDEIIAALQAAQRQPGRANIRGLMRRAQPYLVAVRRNGIDRLAADGLVSPLGEDLWLWEGRYDDARGIGRLDAPGLSAADLVV